MVNDKDRGKILDPKEPLPEKRKHCYVHKPDVYEISGCPKCGGNNTTWSEYDGYCWCYDCQVDYVPEQGGVFDGPIGLGLMEILGISLDRINLETGERFSPRDERFNTTWP